MDGAMYVDSRFNSHVGIGSSGHDFVGALFITWIISDTVAGWKADKVGTSHVTMSGSVADAVEARMLATLLRKNETKSSVDNFVADGCSTELADCVHSRRRLSARSS